MDFDTTLDGRDVFIGTDAGGSIFAVLDDLVVALRNENIDGEALSTALNDALTATDAGLDRVLTARTDAGEQLRIMESRTRLLESGELQAATRLAGITATDYAKVVSDMQTNQLAVQAAMATYAQISRLSLFDYL
jgi:flagellar hook-associated protein 3 FlgL